MTIQHDLYPIISEVRLLVAAGLQFATTHHERERYLRLRQVCAQLVALAEHTTPAAALTHLQGDLFDQRVSPLSTADAVVLRDDRMLLIKRHDNGLWALPGGLVEVNQTLTEAALRELQEETGLDGCITALLGIFDSQRWDSQEKVHLHHAVFLVEVARGEPHPTAEAVDVEFFRADELPPLAPGHHRRVPFLFRLLHEELSIPYIDPPAGERDDTI